MIYTVTLNPSLDYHLDPGSLTPGGLHRCSTPYYVAGGKGICVSTVLTSLEVPNTALGFAGGFVGAQICHMLNDMGIAHDFTPIKQTTRQNVKLDCTPETELNAPGPAVTAAEWESLHKKVRALQKGDILIMSGSVCAGLPQNPYRILAQTAKKAGADFVLDTTAENMADILSLHPLFVKPNLQELCGMIGRPLVTHDEITAACNDLILQGAQAVLCTMGGDGAILVTPNGAHYCPAPAGDVISTIGSGDSTVAGLCAMWDKSDREKLAFAVACGSASAFVAGLADKQQIMTLYKETLQWV